MILVNGCEAICSSISASFFCFAKARQRYFSFAYHISKSYLLLSFLKPAEERGEALSAFATACMSALSGKRRCRN